MILSQDPVELKLDANYHLKNIETDVLSALRKAQQNYLRNSNGRRLNTWHVSDFVSECLRKTHYGKLYPEKFDVNKSSIFFLGHIVHEHTQLSKITELTMCYDLDNDISLTPEQVQNMPFDQLGSIITGTLDDLMKVGEHFVIADKKTYNGGGWYKKTAPDTSYELQVNIYRVLLEASYGIDASYGCLLYLDKKSNLDPTPIAFELKPITQTKQRMKEILNELRGGNPKPNPCWLCNGKNKKKEVYCSYLDICKQENPEAHVVAEEDK